MNLLKTLKKIENKRKQELISILNKGASVDDICDRMDINYDLLAEYLSNLNNDGYVVDEVNGKIALLREIRPTENVYREKWNKDKILRFALVSDTHLCSNSQQLTHLNWFYDECYRQGVESVYHCGDLVDGDDIYPGHKFEVFKIGSDAQKDYAVKHYPKRQGIKTKFITGNHDLKYYSKMGCDIGQAITNERSDMEYLGQYYARVYLTPNCILQLEHPLGKPSYAVSYRTQRKIDNMRGGDKPQILAEGHYHYQANFVRRNVHAFCLPSFQDHTKFSRRLGLESDNGAFIIEIRVTEDGTITKLSSEFYPFLIPIEHDY